jgi:RNA-directed DNA polymerase
MRREFHVRFWEGPGVRSPRATRLLVGFQHHADAVRFLGELRERLRRFALELHPDKTRLLAFGLYAQARRAERGLKGTPETFNFLGFTHACGKTRSGKFLLVRRTMRERMRAKLGAVKIELMRRRHLPLQVQGEWLGAVVRGFFAYHAVPTNIRALQSLNEPLRGGEPIRSQHLIAHP